MYNITFATLITNLLPHFLRGPVMLAWLQVLLHPVEELYAGFIAYRDEKLYEARITGQVDSLEWMLNDKYYNNGALRLIYIDDNDAYQDDIFLYNRTELETETFIYNTGEIPTEDTFILNTNEGDSGYDFIVYVPAALVFDMDILISRLNAYKLAGTSFQIKTY